MRPLVPVPPTIALALLVSIAAGCTGTGAAAPPVGSPPPPASRPAAPPTESPEPRLEGAPFETPRTGVEPTASPAPSVAQVTAPPDAEPFAVDLFRRGDFVPQYTFEWCVGASIQMTLAMAGASDDRSRAAQRRLWELARDRSFSPFGGANPRGWVAALNELGVGPYELVSVPDRDAALRLAASALRLTSRPVGLVMWRGRHAWVMSGFTALGDPRTHPQFTVTGVRVLDPLYPHGSRVWGSSPKPDSLVTPEVLGKQFVPRLRGRVDLGVPPGYLLVLPRPAA